MDIQQRLKFLQQRQLIDEEIIQIVQSVRELLLQWQVELDNKMLFLQFTHFAMALGRIKRGVEVQPLREDMLQELKSAPLFSQVFYMLQQILERIPFPIPANEQSYFIANLYSLLLAQPQILQHLPAISEA